MSLDRAFFAAGSLSARSKWREKRWTRIAPRNPGPSGGREDEVPPVRRAPAQLPQALLPSPLHGHSLEAEFGSHSLIGPLLFGRSPDRSHRPAQPRCARAPPCARWQRSGDRMSRDCAPRFAGLGLRNPASRRDSADKYMRQKMIPQHVRIPQERDALSCPRKSRNAPHAYGSDAILLESDRISRLPIPLPVVKWLEPPPLNGPPPSHRGIPLVNLLEQFRNRPPAKLSRHFSSNVKVNA